METEDGESFDYTHNTVNHEYTYVAEDGTHTNTIEGTWFGVKQNIKPRQRTAKLLDLHLFEFMWRRENAGNLWNALVDALVHTKYGEEAEESSEEEETSSEEEEEEEED